MCLMSLSKTQGRFEPSPARHPPAADLCSVSKLNKDADSAVAMLRHPVWYRRAKQTLFTSFATGNLHLKVCVSYVSVMELVSMVGLKRVGI
jgi:hypothetical protein